MKVKVTILPDGWSFIFDCYTGPYGLESDDTIILQDGSRLDIDYGQLLLNGTQEAFAGKLIQFEEV